MNIGIDHGYYAIKTRHFSFPAGVAVYSHEPYTLQNALELEGRYFVCGTGRQPILRDKTENDNYYLLTLAAIAKEMQQQGAPAVCSVTIAAGLPLARYGRDKKPFREYLLRSSQPVSFRYEGIPYKITIKDVKLFPQGYSAIALHPELVQNEPSVLLMDIGGWTVDLMRLDNCLLVKGEHSREGILVEAEGYSYARYAAHVPDCSMVRVGDVPVQYEYPAQPPRQQKKQKGSMSVEKAEPCSPSASEQKGTGTSGNAGGTERTVEGGIPAYPHHGRPAPHPSLYSPCGLAA